MRLVIVLHLIGTILRVFGATLLAPLIVALYWGERSDAAGFVAAGLLALAAGQAMRSRINEREYVLRRVEGLAIVAGTWLAVAAVGAVPYAVGGLSPIDAVFESMSGLTATGATILTRFEDLGRGLMFWRSMSQWLGGMGVITLFIAVLPRLAIGGRQLFFAEAPGPTDEGLTPQIRKTAAVLWRLYVGLTVAEFLALMLAGMPAYDAICHAMTTISAGGFSPNRTSIMGYESAAIEWIICGFMFLAGANFALQYRALCGRPRALFGDNEFRVYAGIVVVATLALSGFLWQAGTATVNALRVALFQTLSILTTTGYASTDYNLWTDQSRFVLLVLMFIGGCAGSAAGGPKVVRQVLIARYTLLELKKTLHPRAVLPVKLDGKVVPEEVMRAVLVFLLFYLLVFALCAGLVVTLGADILTGVTAGIAALGNVGPGLNQIGPMASYADLHPVSKLVLTGAMWVGRLEVLTVLALLRPEVWRSVRAKAD